MRFCTAVSCMDGRMILPLTAFLQARFGVDYVDIISEPGPNGILARQSPPAIVESIFNRLNISVERHGSVGIAVAGHFDCSGNAGGELEQAADTLAAIRCIQQRYPKLPVIGLWVNEYWQVNELLKSAQLT